MTQQSSVNQQFTNNADGFSLAGGTTARSMTVTGGNVSVTASGSQVYTFPAATDTLAGLATSQTFTVSQTFTGGVLLTTSGMTLSAVNIATDTTTGMKIGTSTSQKVGFFNATPVVQQSATTDILSALSNLGLRASGGNAPLSTSGLVSLIGQTAVGTGGIRSTPVARTTSATLSSTSAWVEYCSASSGAYNLTLPSAAAAAGQQLIVKKTDSSGNAVTVLCAGSDTIEGVTSKTLALQYDFIIIGNDGVSIWYKIGGNV